MNPLRHDPDGIAVLLDLASICPHPAVVRQCIGGVQQGGRFQPDLRNHQRRVHLDPRKHALRVVFILDEILGERLIAHGLVIREFEKLLLEEEAHYIMTLQWHRIIPHSSKVKGWTVTPSHYLNNTLDTVWLDQ